MIIVLSLLFAMLSWCQNTNCDACAVVTKWCQNTFIDLQLRERKQFCDGKVSLHLMCVKVPCEKRKWRHMDSFLFLRQNIFSKKVNNGAVHLDRVVISHWEYVSYHSILEEEEKQWRSLGKGVVYGETFWGMSVFKERVLGAFIKVVHAFTERILWNNTT